MLSTTRFCASVFLLSVSQVAAQDDDLARLLRDHQTLSDKTSPALDEVSPGGGDLTAQSVDITGDLRVRGALRVGHNTLYLLNNVVYPPDNINADLILSDVAAANTGRIGFARLNGPEFSAIEVGIGLGDPQHKFHVHNGPLIPFSYTPREVRGAFTNVATGKTANDGLVLGIDIVGNAQINQKESLPLSLATSDIDRITISATGEVGIGTTTPLAKLHVAGTPGIDGIRFPDGTVQTTAAVSQVPQLPQGVIVMWSGSTSSVPQGWALCDGQNGTPNLLDRFIVGAGGSYTPGDTGGSTSHQHLTPGVSGPGYLIDDNSNGTASGTMSATTCPPTMLWLISGNCSLSGL